MAETQNIEYKRSWRDEYLKWICAFANAEGGELFIGIDDDGSVAGVDNAKVLLDELPNKIASTMGLVCPVALENRDGKEVVRVTVKKSTAPVSYHGEYHIRSGTTKQLLTGPALTQFVLEKTGTKWDGMTIENVTVEQLDYESFEIFRKKAVSSKRMSLDDVNVSNEELLEKLGLISSGKLTRAAVLLFHRHPEKWVTTCYSRIAFFETDADIRFQDEIYGSLFIQAERIMELLWLKYMIAPITYHGMIRVDNYPYSKDAIRELVYNALMHQNFIDGGPILISVYRDKIYIANSGGLPKGWSVDMLFEKHTSKTRNDLVASTFFRAGYVEKWGRGIEKVCSYCNNYGNPKPAYTVHPEDVMVRVDAVTLPVNIDTLPVTLPVTTDTQPVTTTVTTDTQPVTTPVTTDTQPVKTEIVKEDYNGAKYASLLCRLLFVLDHPRGMTEILEKLKLKNRLDVRVRYISPAMKYGYIEYTIPEHPNSRFQKYRLTQKGEEFLNRVKAEKG